MLYYCALEPYKERYTFQLSQWMMHKWHHMKVDFRLMAPEINATQIETGQVLDCFRRSRWSFMQVDGIVDGIRQGKITSDDTIYLEDLFTPGAEAIPYCCHLASVKPKVYAYWWAQSVDEFDFTAPMRQWMEFYELMMLNWLDGIFVACPSMKKRIVSGEMLVVDSNKIHVVGLPFDSGEVIGRLPGNPKHNYNYRKNQVVFSSRWDKEKNPDFFCKVAESVLRAKQAPHDTTFVVCTGSKTLRSNDPSLVKAANRMRAYFPTQFVVCENLSKQEYYRILCESKVQFNCADQDWVSFTLLEAAVCGCYPIYPRFRSFPETLDGVPGQNYLYTHKNLNSATAAIESILNRDDLWSSDKIKSRDWIYKRFDYTTLRMAKIMGLGLDLNCVVEGSYNPFDNAKWVRE